MGEGHDRDRRRARHSPLGASPHPPGPGARTAVIPASLPTVTQLRPALHVASPGPDLWWAQRNSPEPPMFKFLGKTAGIIFLIGLAVVIGLLMLIF